MGKKQLKVRVDEEVVEKAKQSAAGLGLSLNDYLALLLGKPEAVSATYAVEEHEVIKLKRNKPVRVFLTAEEHEVIADLAKQRGWSMTQEIRWRVLATISKQPKLDKAEVAEINQLRTAINIVGRNLNSSMKKGLIDMNTFADDVMSIRQLISQTLEQVDSLREAATDRWAIQRK